VDDVTKMLSSGWSQLSAVASVAATTATTVVKSGTQTISQTLQEKQVCGAAGWGPAAVAALHPPRCRCRRAWAALHAGPGPAPPLGPALAPPHPFCSQVGAVLQDTTKVVSEKGIALAQTGWTGLKSLYATVASTVETAAKDSGYNLNLGGRPAVSQCCSRSCCRARCSAARGALRWP
jgi:hypothetical protein